MAWEALHQTWDRANKVVGKRRRYVVPFLSVSMFTGMIASVIKQQITFKNHQKNKVSKDMEDFNLNLYEKYFLMQENEKLKEENYFLTWLSRRKR